MNTKDRNQSDDRLRESEIKKVEAETRKIELEQKELERKLNLPWYRKPQFIQAAAAGIIGIPLLSFYMKEFAVPLIKSENIELSQELTVTKTKFELEKIKQEINYLSQLQELRDAYADLDSEKAALVREYEILSKSMQLSESQRDAFRQKFAKAKNDLTTKQAFIDSLDSEIAKKDKDNIKFIAWPNQQLVIFPERILIRAIVKAPLNVAGANVSAVVTRPEASQLNFVLYDDGSVIHGDEVANDGVYSNFFSNYSESGLYSFAIIVRSKGDGYLLTNELAPSAAPVRAPIFTRSNEFDVRVEGIGQFTDKKM